MVCDETAPSPVMGKIFIMSSCPTSPFFAHLGAKMKLQQKNDVLDCLEDYFSEVGMLDLKKVIEAIREGVVKVGLVITRCLHCNKVEKKLEFEKSSYQRCAKCQVVSFCSDACVLNAAETHSIVCHKYIKSKTV